MRFLPTDHFAIFQKAFVARWNYPLISGSMQQVQASLKEHLIVADEGSYVSYLEGCTAPIRDENQLHAAVVELVAHG